MSRPASLDSFAPASAPGQPHTKLVDRLAIHGRAVDFRTLCERVVPPETRYLVFDLDRTLHLRRNMGELLGWEMIALFGYGERYLADNGTRPPGRLLLDFSVPKKLARYIAVGGRFWAAPGLFYLIFGKLGALSSDVRRATFLLFGPEPVRFVQSMPQTTLLHLLTLLPLETLRALARGVWDRHGDDQVIEPEDIAWLRARCPNIEIIVTSASPRPVLEVAAEKLGVNHVDYSTLEEHEGFLSAPLRLRRLLNRNPRRIAPPSTVRINSSYAKIEGLLERYPDLCDEGVVTVGITDTGYGEDHCWAEFFSRVVDINSDTPFPPIAPAGSPLVEVHSASVLSRKERRLRAAGDPDYLDPRRRPMPSGVDHVFTKAELAALLGPLRDEIESLAGVYNQRTTTARAGTAALEARTVEIQQRIERVVNDYNVSPEDLRPAALAELNALMGQIGRLTRRMTRIERPLAEAAFALTRAREQARQMLDAKLAAMG